jgi:hypothetical protein
VPYFNAICLLAAPQPRPIFVFDCGMVSLSVSISRFTSVPDEHYDTIESAFAAKPLAQWTALVPHSQLTLKIEKNPDKVVMKCVDGDDIRVQSLLL